MSKRTAKKLAANETKITAIKQETRTVVEGAVRQVLKLYAQNTPISPDMSQRAARDAVMDFLVGAREIPVLPQICSYMVDCGFDASLITYRDVKGTPAGFIDGIPLLKFVGFLHEDAPTLDELDEEEGAPMRGLALTLH